MTATERLRQLLDERGVEWTRGRYDRREFTRWYIRNNSGFIAASFRDVLADGNEKPYLRCEFYHITPEQAVDATLGRGTCEDDLREALADLWPRASFTMCPENRESWLERLAELGVEVES